MFLLILALVWMRRKKEKYKQAFFVMAPTGPDKEKPTQTDWGCINGVD